MEGRFALQPFTLPRNPQLWKPHPYKETLYDIAIAPITRIEHTYTAYEDLNHIQDDSNKTPIITENAEKFETVDITKKKKKQSSGGPQRTSNFATPTTDNHSFTSSKTPNRRVNNKNKTNRPRHLGEKAVGHLTSLLVRDKWSVLNNIPLSSLERNSEQNVVSHVQNVAYHGHLACFDTSYDYVASYKPSPVKPTSRRHPHVTPIEDEVLREIVMRSSKGGKRYIVTNESILSTILTAPRSIFSWEVKITKMENVVFLDWREDDALADMFTVDETSTQPPIDTDEGSNQHIDSASSLARESTKLNRDVSQMLLNHKQRTKLNLDPSVPRHENVFDGLGNADLPSSTTYLYREWSMESGSGQELTLLCRCTIDGILKTPQNKKGALLRIFTVNEHDTDEWRHKIQTGRGAILANFIKTNACKVARWATMAIVSAVDQVKLAFVTRARHNSSTSHLLLGLETKTPLELAVQINLNMPRMWGSLAILSDYIFQMTEGNFMLVREAGKGNLALYDLGMSEDEEGDDERNEEGSENSTEDQ